MKPFITMASKKIYLPQEVDPHRFEVCTLESNGMVNYLLCPKVKIRYRQATGIHIEKNESEFQIPMVNGKIVKRTFPLDGMQTIAIQIDWSVGGSISIKHEEAEETNAE